MSMQGNYSSYLLFLNLDKIIFLEKSCATNICYVKQESKYLQLK
jgi:hypothetical protein